MSRARMVIAAIVAALAAFALAPPAFAAPGPSDAPEWWFDRWQVNSLWASGADGRGVTIAEIDSGVNANLPELKSKILKGTDFGVPGGVGWIDREVDPFGHGTAMASIMVAKPGTFGIEGIAPGARILPIAIPLSGTRDSGGNDHLADAIKWAADHGAKIISMSLGANRSPSDDLLACPAAEQTAIYYALSKGAILVAAAGNNGPSENTVEQPSVCLGVVSVGAIDSAGKVASFSTRRPNLTVTAPGVDIPSLGRIAGQAYNGEGTSQATALTSASLALIWSKFPRLTGRQVLARLLATLDSRHATSDPAYGYGQINPGAAIRTTVASTAPDVVFSAADPFIAQAAAQAKAAPNPPPPITYASKPPGVYQADTPPSDVNGEVETAAGIAGAAFLALILLITFGLLGRRRRNSYRALLAPAWVGGSGGAGSSVPADPSMPWHDVFEPPAWAAPEVPPPWSAPVGEASLVYPPPSLVHNEPPPPEWLPPQTRT